MVFSRRLCLLLLVTACGFPRPPDVEPDDANQAGLDATPDGATATDASTVSCPRNGTTVVIANNHGHALTVSKDEVVAAVDRTYDIMGTATHTHTVTVTAAMFATLTAGTSVMVDSSLTLGHVHAITIACR